MVRREQGGVWVTLKETIAATADEVLECMSTPEGLTRWLSVGAEFEPRAGGRLSLAWDREFSHVLETTIAEYDLSQGKVSWLWYPAPLEDWTVKLEFIVDRNVETGAKVIVRLGPFAETTDQLLAAADAAESWRWYLCNLRSVLESKHDMRALRPL
jgi:uncharacterized protein YndB with AHSA1/START domain